MGFPNFRQPDLMDCGPTCIRIVSKYYGRNVSLKKLRSFSETTREGSSLRLLSSAAEKIGFRTLGVKLDFKSLKKEVNLPCILHWDKHHFVVLYKISKKFCYISDPEFGLIKYNTEEFLKHWIGDYATTETKEGIALLLEPSPIFSDQDSDEKTDKKGLPVILNYIRGYRRFFIQIGIGLLTASILNLIFPFLTQAVVDIGIQNQNIDFIYLILGAQIFIILGRYSIEIVRGWILLHISTRVNIALLTDFFIKLMKLPISFFDVKMTGDIFQRIGDHQRIEKLLTSNTLNVLFSLVTLVIFSAVLAWFDLKIFGIFAAGSIIYFLWIILFLKRRKVLDYKGFGERSAEQSKVFELINGMQEIKLHNAERSKRWEWEFIQVKLFKIAQQGLTLQQIQSIGSSLINELKNIIITAIAAKLVIDGEITLGMMMSISYILGQLNSPINQVINFIYAVQDAKIAFVRLAEIHGKDDEENEEEGYIHEIDMLNDFLIKDLSFRYPGAMNPTLQNIDLTIPAKKVTAIVGQSGSGKTTLLKLLLKIYNPTTGKIIFGDSDLQNISHSSWREKCGIVMQEGHIFNAAIKDNIALGQEYIDKERVKTAAKIADVKKFIESLPLAYNTQIGQEGIGMSTGQKQRILIARAIYKNPSIMMLDEATSSLDTNTEAEIVSNLNKYFLDRTVVVIAHRLSTVKNADQIVVLNEGKIAEIGTHKDLVKKRGHYFELVKNQLELSK